MANFQSVIQFTGRFYRLVSACTNCVLNTARSTVLQDCYSTFVHVTTVIFIQNLATGWSCFAEGTGRKAPFLED